LETNNLRDDPQKTSEIGPLRGGACCRELERKLSPIKGRVTEAAAQDSDVTNWWLAGVGDFVNVSSREFDHSIRHRTL